MPGASWRLIDDLDSRIDASGQMARDLALLDEVAAGAGPALRWYQWDPPALSLGRFQPDDDVDRGACARWGVEVVRRPTGGRALLHGGDLTYAVVMPRPTGPGASVDGIYAWIASALIAGLDRIGVTAAVARHEGPAGAVCLATQQGADLRVGERKVCGSAQVHRAGVILQHGSILLRRLHCDESDLVTGAQDRAELVAATVTLAELGAPTEPPVVADAITDGFRSALDIDFTSSTSSTSSTFR